MKNNSHIGKSRIQMNTVHLPPELMIEILLRLPVKSLVRFKSVCKSWFFLISDPHFAISHFELCAARTEKLAFIAPFNSQILSIDFNASLHDDSASTALKLDLLIPNNYYYYDSVALNSYYVFHRTCYYHVYIIGSCRGFLLLDLNDILCVWNPSNGVHKIVYWSPIQSSTMSFKFSIFLRGFGYDPSKDDYLVVLASYNRDHRPDDRLTRVEFFSLRNNAWKEIEGTNLSYGRCSSYYSTPNEVGWFLNGAIHWLAFSYDILIDVLVAFDLSERGLLQIPLPVDFEYNYFRTCSLGLLGDFLSLCAVRLNHSAEIWVMKEYKVQSSWTKTIVLSPVDIPTRCFYPICYTKSGDIVGTNITTGLAKFNTKGQLLEHRSYCNNVSRMRVAVYTESLLSLPCNSEQAEVDN